MNTTVEALLKLYKQLGGSLTDTYDDIADGEAVGNYTKIPDCIEACSKKASSGGEIHYHDNKSTLDKIGEDDETGVLLFDGSEVNLHNNIETLDLLETSDNDKLLFNGVEVGGGSAPVLRYNSTDNTIYDADGNTVDAEYLNGLVTNGIFPVINYDLGSSSGLRVYYLTDVRSSDGNIQSYTWLCRTLEQPSGAYVYTITFIVSTESCIVESTYQSYATLLNLEKSGSDLVANGVEFNIFSGSSSVLWFASVSESGAWGVMAISSIHYDETNDTYTVTATYGTTQYAGTGTGSDSLVLSPVSPQT